MRAATVLQAFCGWPYRFSRPAPPTGPGLPRGQGRVLGDRVRHRRHIDPADSRFWLANMLRSLGTSTPSSLTAQLPIVGASNSWSRATERIASLIDGRSSDDFAVARDRLDALLWNFTMLGEAVDAAMSAETDDS